MLKVVLFRNVVEYYLSVSYCRNQICKKLSCFDLLLSSAQRRKIQTDEKAKVVASVFGGRIYSIPCCASYFD